MRYFWEKKDIQQLEAICRELDMSPSQRRDFGDFLEAEKETGNTGSKNDRGDFTYRELQQKAKEFLGLE